MNESSEKLVKKIEKISERSSAFRTIISEICRSNKWIYGEAWIKDNKADQLMFELSWHNGNSIFEKFSKFSSMCKFAKGLGLIGSVWEKKEAVHYTDIQKLGFLRSDVATKTGFSAGVGFPIITENEVQAVIAFFVFKQNDISEDKIKNAEEILNKVSPMLSQNFKLNY